MRKSPSQRRFWKTESSRSGPAGGRDHGVGLGAVEAHRLVGDHVLARLEGGDRLGRVQVVGGGQHHQLHLVVGQDLLEALPGPQALGGDLRARLRRGWETTPFRDSPGSARRTRYEWKQRPAYP